MENREYWSGKFIDELAENEIFVFGANPQARHFAGAAKAALKFGALPVNGNKPGIARGLSKQTYALITKSLEAGYVEPETGIKYEKEGYCSVSVEQIKANVDEMYECARQHSDKKFLITYQYESWPNGSPKKSLNGYTSQEILEMFVRDNIPSNIVFHDSYKPHLEKLLQNKVVQEDKPKEYTYFFHLTSPFSNFHPAKFEYKGLTFISNEQFMMYSKAKTFGDEETAKKILAINNDPLAKDFIEGRVSREEIVKSKDLSDKWNQLMMRAKKLGRGVQNYDENVWNEKRIKVVFFGAREKFTQNSDLKEILMNTGDTLMVEASPYDKIWGIGLSAADAKKISPEKWPGQNLLGLVLDKLKSDFRNELNKRPKP